MKPLLVLAAFPMVLMGWASCSHSGTGHAALPDPACRGQIRSGI